MPAEIVTQVLDRGGSYSDGDAIQVFNTRQIKHVNAQKYAHESHCPFTSDGLRDSSHPAKDYYDNTHQLRMVRVSGEEYDIENLWDHTTVRERGVKKILAELLAHPKPKVFGTPGAEFWYGGRKDFSDANLDAVWEAIEEKLGVLEIDHRTMRWRGRVLRNSLVMPVTDMDDARARDIAAPQTTPGFTHPTNHLLSRPPLIVRKRKNIVLYRTADLGVPIEDVEDRSKAIDIRGEKIFPQNLIVQGRPIS